MEIIKSASPDETGKQRMFLALWPDEDERQSLAALAAACVEKSGGKVVRAQNIHLTLVFLGDMGRPQIEAVKTVAAGVPVLPFTLVLDRLGFWAQRKIIWAGCGRTPDALERLVGSLKAGLRHLGLRMDDRPYKPHLTLVRKAHRSPLLRMTPLEWAVDGFCLVRSTLSPNGSIYEVIGQWGP